MSEFTADTIEKIIEIYDARREIETIDIDGYTYTATDLRRVEAPRYRPGCIDVYGLDSICKLIRSELGETDAKRLYVRVKAHNEVDVFTPFDDHMGRDSLYRARADVPGFNDGFSTPEKAAIELRSLFLPGEGVNYLLGLLSRMTKEDSATTEDNGVTQSITVKAGVSLKGKEQIEPRVALTPFRTFLEIEQPASEYILRVHDDGAVGLFEADGGVWKLESEKRIADYFETALADLIERGAVVVMR